MVFSTGACERLDLHLCSMPGATQIRCLQNTLKYVRVHYDVRTWCAFVFRSTYKQKRLSTNWWISTTTTKVVWLINIPFLFNTYVCAFWRMCMYLSVELTKIIEWVIDIVNAEFNTYISPQNADFPRAWLWAATYRPSHIW